MSITIDGDNITVQLETTNVNVSVGGAPVVGEGGGGSWGSITGTLSAQTDLQAALDAKQAAGSYQAADDDLTAIATLTPSNDDFIQRKSGIWVNRTIAQVKTDLAISNVDNTSDANKPISTAAQTQFDSRDYYFNIINAIGVDWLGETLTKFWEINSGSVLADGQIRYFPIWIKAAGTISSVRFWQHVVGSYTPDNENSISIHTISSGTLTEIGSTGNIANLWQTGSSNSLRTENFSSPVSVSKGLHWMGLLYNQSAASTPPQIGVNSGMPNAGVSSIGLSNSVKISGIVNAQSSIPSSQAMSGISTAAINNWMQVL